ncbi:MAG: peptidoglycan-binding protein [Promicromonosporaceae bacterium]|nr:peptidoglycan-binding protein [Promicromonosporaceae bacterium]
MPTAATAATALPKASATAVVPQLALPASGENLVGRTVTSIQNLVGTTPDGVWGPATTAAIVAWQTANGLHATGNWDQASDARGFPTDFEPGNIISDAVMFNPNAMSEAQVNEFIAAQGVGCHAGPGNICLKDFRMDTWDRPPTAYCPGAYVGAANESAGTIISKAATACGINPQVLLVTMQKEQSLVLAPSGRPPVTYDRALGFRCPETGCEAQYAGFFNQVYHAASRLQEYRIHTDVFPYHAGATYNIMYNSQQPRCGTQRIYMANQATANLYNYTPYVPNRESLTAEAGVVVDCGAFGNRNFHRYFNLWFGNPRHGTTMAPTPPAGPDLGGLPLGAFDIAERTSADSVTVMGWAFIPGAPGAAPTEVHAYVDGQAVLSFSTSLVRADVNQVYGRAADAIAGFSVPVSVTPGSHQICLYAIQSLVGPNPQIGCKEVGG